MHACQGAALNLHQQDIAIWQRNRSFRESKSCCDLGDLQFSHDAPPHLFNLSVPAGMQGQTGLRNLRAKRNVFRTERIRTVGRLQGR